MASKKDRKCRKCPTLIYRDNVTGLCADCLRIQQSEVADKRREAAERLTPPALVASDRALKSAQADLLLERKKYAEVSRRCTALEQELALVKDLDQAGVTPFAIEPRHPSGTSEGTVVLCANDWHVEERVDPSIVGGVNAYNLEIAKERAGKFFRSGLRLTKLLQQDIKVDTMVLALLGDFISNDIHEEFPEINQLQPMHAIVFAQNLIVGGIEFLLENSKLNLVLVCHSGNHARTTRTTRGGAENGHSIEYLMYLHLAAYFHNHPEKDRLKFIISDGYHSYLPVYDKTVRFHHGHRINYQGGIGGIFIPAFKAISQWDKIRRADLDVFGHFHQTKDGSKFLTSGSLIGFNSYALDIKADYEPPSQTLFLMDKRRGRTCTWPVLFTR